MITLGYAGTLYDHVWLSWAFWSPFFGSDWQAVLLKLLTHHLEEEDLRYSLQCFWVSNCGDDFINFQMKSVTCGDTAPLTMTEEKAYEELQRTFFHMGHCNKKERHWAVYVAEYFLSKWQNRKTMAKRNRSHKVSQYAQNLFTVLAELPPNVTNAGIHHDTTTKQVSRYNCKCRARK